jgi:hypothetical protein
MRPAACAGEGEHRHRAQEGIDRDQVVDLHLRPKVMPITGLADDAVGRDAASPPKNSGSISDIDENQLAQAQRDHRERRAGLLGGDVAQQHGEEDAGQAADQRDQADRHRQPAADLFSAWMARKEPRPV